MNYDLLEMVQKYPNVTISCTLNDMLQFGKMILEGAQKQKAEEIANAQGETYHSPAEVAKNLQVDLSTLWRWEKQGYLTGVKVGGKKRYRKSDIDKLLKN
jgi:excisionase family DNA binding protein